jgi:predicted transcriptional regulator
MKEEGKTQREIAEEIGVAQQAVDYQLTKTDKCQILSDPSNIIPSPSQKQEPVDDYDDVRFC